MPRETVEAAVAVRRRRKGSRSVDERIAFRIPSLVKRVLSAAMRLPRGSRLRRLVLAYWLRRVFETFNRQDVELTVRGIGPDFEMYAAQGGTSVGVDMQDVYRGVPGYRAFMRDWTEPWAEIRLEPSRFIDCGDGHVVVLSEMIGRGARSGVEVRRPFGQLLVIRGGRLLRVWSYWSHEEALEAVGLGKELS
jgi:ketosteroid isomerase-like protein